MKVIISAGGTGGHIYPALAIINKLKEKDKNVDILYIGTTRRMEKDLIPNMGINYEGIDVTGLAKNPIKMVKSLYGILKGVKQCKKIMKKFKPDIVIGVGGYVTVPVVLAAKKLGIKIILHEQNSIPGKANKFLSKFADKVCVSMKSSLDYFKNGVYTGNPRSEEVNNAKPIKKEDIGLTSSKKLVVITTGSLGASTVNDIVISSLNKFSKENYEVLLITGKDGYNNYKKIKKPSNVFIVPYIDDMPRLLKVTDLIVSRAGATTIAEITSLGIPSILIPSPYVPNNHQVLNAKDLKDNNATIMIEEKDLSSDELLYQINRIIKDKKVSKELQDNAKKLGVKDSASKIYKEIIKITK